MTTLLILLTPVLLLAIVALFGFVGCGFSPGKAYTTYTPSVVNGLAGETTITAYITNLSDNELLVATLQWGGPPTPTPTFASAGGQVNLYPAPAVNNGQPFSWNGMNIQVFINNVDNPGDGNLAVTVTLPAPSPVPWSLCVWPFATLAKDPVFGAVSTDSNFIGTEIKTPEPITLSRLDALYAVAFAADTPAKAGGNGAFPGTNWLSAPPGWGFVTYDGLWEGDSTNTPNPLLIGFVARGPGTGTLTPLAINRPTNARNTKPRGFMVALGIKWG